MNTTGSSLVRDISPTSPATPPSGPSPYVAENRDPGPETLTNHWHEMPHWPADREMWSFYLTLAGQSDVHRVVRRYQRRLRSFPQLDMIALPSLHITLQGIRFVDEADPDHIDLLANSVQARLSSLDLPTLSTLGPVTDTDAVVLPVVPREPLVRLRDGIQSTVRSALGDDYLYKLPEPRNGFDPHISLAYANAEVSGESVLAAALGGTRAMPATFRVRHLSLLKLRRETRRWSWQGERTIGIGGSALAGAAT